MTQSGLENQPPTMDAPTQEQTEPSSPGTQATENFSTEVMPPEPDRLPGIPGYEIEGILGRGGMGVVYRARHLALKREVALKMVLAGSHASAQELARFRHEAQAVARLRHPNILQIYEVGEHDGLPFFSLELMDG